MSARILRNVAGCGIAVAICSAATFAGVGVADAAAPTAATAATAVSRDATFDSALRGQIPKGLPYDLGHGRMVNGKLKVSKDAPPHSHVNIKHIDGAWKRKSVRFVDVAGNSAKEAVVIISASAGGVGWPNYVAVYDKGGKLINWWDSGEATAKGRKGHTGGARETTSFVTMTRKSVDVRVNNISVEGQGECCGTGRDTFRLSKGANGAPQWKLITRRNR